MTASAGYARPPHPVLRSSVVLALSVGLSLCFVYWTARYGVAGFATVCGDDAMSRPTPAEMVALLAGFALIGAALLSLAVVWRVLGQQCGLRLLVVVYNVFAVLWLVAGLLLTGVAGTAIMRTLISNASCT